MIRVGGHSPVAAWLTRDGFRHGHHLDDPVILALDWDCIPTDDVGMDHRVTELDMDQLSVKRRTRIEMETARMERARDLLLQIVDGHRNGVATVEGVALISATIGLVALLEREIGRRLTGGLSDLEVLHRSNH
jgi:hypothetical protein